MKLAMEVGGIMMYHFTIESLAFYSLLLASLSSFSILMTNNDVKNLGDVTHIEAAKHLRAQLITSPPSLKNILIEVIHHDVTNVYGLLHLIILAIHSVVNHQHTCSGCHTG